MSFVVKVFYMTYDGGICAQHVSIDSCSKLDVYVCQYQVKSNVEYITFYW